MGDKNSGTHVVSDPVERLLANCDRSAGSCWLYLRAVNNNGYPMTAIGSRRDGTRRNVPASNVIYERFHGRLPDDYEPDHTCKVRHCLNPDHLKAIPRRDNRNTRGRRTVNG